MLISYVPKAAPAMAWTSWREISATRPSLKTSPAP
jgi:hypothetical protein